MSDRPPLPGWLLALLFGGVTVAWVCVLQVGLAVVVMGFAAATDAGDPTALLTDPLVLALGSGAQMVGLAALAGLTVWLAKERFTDAFALRGFGAISIVGALLVGGSVGIWSGWIAQELLEHVPMFNSDIFEIIEEAMLDGPLFSRLAFYAVVVFGAPLCEELVFRGLLWHGLEKSAGPAVAWLVTSLLFAGYHLVPIHVLSVFTTGALIGLLRWGSGSIYPAIAAHFVNNALATVLVVWLAPKGEEWIVTLPQALAGLVVALAAAAAVMLWGRRASADALVGSAAADGASEA